MNYEEKYNEALERALKLRVQNPFDTVGQMVEHIFPELKESEEERIRKGLIKAVSRTFEGNKLFGTDVTREEALAWLEKQGEQKPYGQRKECEDCQFNYAGECKGYCALKRNEHKPTDKVEPKFHPGDWIIDNEYGEVLKVTKSDANSYEITNQDGEVFGIMKEDVECNHRLWTIEDANDGDVLACNEEILLFKSYSIQGRISLYCWYNGQTNNFHSKEVVDTLLTTRYKICPATKEQCDTLMKAMTDAGWEFDFEKKELKKIEHKMLDADKVIEWLNDQACQGWIEDVEVDKFVDKFKRDFEIC